MQDMSTNSPASVITNLKDQIYPSSDDDDDGTAAKLSKLTAPPIQQKRTTAQSRFARAQSLDVESTRTPAAKNNNGNITITQDDIDTHNNRHLNGNVRINDGGKLFISEATRRILDRMDANQVENARQSFAKVKLTRKQSGIHPGRVFHGIEWRASSSFSSNVDDNNGDDGYGDGDRRRRSSGICSINSQSRFSMSMGPLGKQFESFDSFVEQLGDDGSDDDSDHDDGGESDDEEAEDDRGRHCKSMGELDKPTLKPVSRTSSKLEEVQEIANETLQRIFRWDSMEKQQMKDNAADATTTTGKGDDADETKEVKDAVFSSDEPATTRVTPGRRQGIALQQSSEPTLVGRPHRTRRRSEEGRQTLLPQRSRNGLSKNQHSSWKPLSSNQRDRKYDDEESEGQRDNGKSRDGNDKNAKGKRGVVGIGNLWNKLTSSFTSQEATPTPPSNHAKQPEKQLSPSAYFRRGKKKARKCQFLHAVALYNFALIRQRELLGEDHVDCGTTLNEIGVCWMMLGERYPALVAFEEALYILQRELGDGAMEVAETTNNIWMILHEEREDMACMMEEGNEDDED